MVSWPSSGKKASESWRCPALVTRASGRHPESASRWILVVSPPLDRPSASRFLSFGSAPDAGRGAQRRPRQLHRIHICWRRVPRPGRVLVRPHRRGIHRHSPPLPFRLIAPRAQTVQDHLPGPVPRPAPMPVIDGLPVPKPLRQIPPWAAHPGPEQNPINHQPVIIPPVPLPRMSRQQRLQPCPLRIAQVMPLQPVIIHRTSQPETNQQDLQDTP